MPGKGWEADGNVSLRSLLRRIGHLGTASAAWQARKMTTNGGDLCRPQWNIFRCCTVGSPDAGVRAISLLVITFLPTADSMYSQREEQETQVAFRFGAPPSGVQVLAHAYRLGLAEALDEFWRTREKWFTTMAETYISNSEVIFYRSSQPGTSWIKRMVPGYNSASRRVVVH
jgi:hypothetical protein